MQKKIMTVRWSSRTSDEKSGIKPIIEPIRGGTGWFPKFHYGIANPNIFARWRKLSWCVYDSFGSRKYRRELQMSLFEIGFFKCKKTKTNGNYLVAISLLYNGWLFFLMGLDKKKARQHKWRIPEKRLLTSTGWRRFRWSYLAMYLFKT